MVVKHVVKRVVYYSRINRNSWMNRTKRRGPKVTEGCEWKGREWKGCEWKGCEWKGSAVGYYKGDRAFLAQKLE